MRMGCKIKWDFCSILMGSEYIYIYLQIYIMYCIVQKMNYITMKHWNLMETVWEWMVISWEHTMGLFEIQWDKMICWRVLPTYIGVDWDVKCDKQVGELFTVDISWSKGVLNHHLVGYKLHSSKQQKWRRYGDLSNRFRVCSQQKQGIRWICHLGMNQDLWNPHIWGGWRSINPSWP
jgi:hypothetical protein